MIDDSREEVPLVREGAAIPDAYRRRLEALLHELMRDESIRRLLCNKEEFTTEPQAERNTRRLKVSLRLVTSAARGS